jgi:formylglycine-generating enzyme required for sulfatase activity/serine/threonine protein kinase
MDKGNTQSQSVSPNSSKERLKSRILKPGESFGNFRVVKCISPGLLANYYHMQHVRDLRDVTLCVFHPRTIEDPKCLKRFERLQAALQGINHEGIPRIQNCVLMNQRHCIFIDAVKGQSLSQYFAEHAKPGAVGIDAEDVTRILTLLLGLLSHAHAQGVDHRDLDTDLIFMQSDGSMQLLGLGVKATLGSKLFDSVVSASVCPLGANVAPARLNSFDVMSPEYRQGIPEDARVDVFASGYIGYWLLTGMKADFSDYKAPSTIVDELPQVWDGLMEAALKRNRDERYQSCRSVLLALKEIADKLQPERAGLIQRQIDRVIVPDEIVARGELATRIYRLAMIGLVGLCLTGLLASFVHSIFSDTLVNKQVVSVAADGEPPNLRLNVTPVGAQVRFVGIDAVFDTRAGGLDLVVQAGDYNLLITAPQYLEQQLPMSIGNVALPRIDIELQSVLQGLQIQAEPGATIALLDEEGLEVELGTTDADGQFHLTRGVSDGLDRIVVRKVGYLPAILEDLSGNLIQVVLAELPSSVTVRTQPSGARVLLNSIFVGRSPVTIDASEGSGNYIVAVESQGHRTASRRVTVESGEHEVIDFGALVDRSAELDFALTFAGVPRSGASALMSDLTVELNGRLLAYGSEALQAVSEGTYAVRLLHPLYTSALQTVKVEDRVDQTLTYLMQPLPGQVELVIPPELEVQVRVAGVDVDDLDGVVPVAANQPVELELRIKNYLTMVRRFNLKPNERIKWEVEPVQIPGPEQGGEWTMPYLVLKLCWIEAGQFLMGSPVQEVGRLPNEGPQTAVRFNQGFWIGKYEVTQAQYAEVMDQNPSSVTRGSLPVDNVSWEDVRLYCQVLTNIERAAGRLPDGHVYRLPTEAEWEYAARSGSVLPFAFGDQADVSNGNFSGAYPVDVEHQLSNTDHYGPLPVGSYPPNDFGLHDAHGNLAEWTLDRYNGRLSGGSRVDPRPREDGRRVVVRGGSWEDFAVRVRSAARDEIRDDTKSNAIGFRVALAPAF